MIAIESIFITLIVSMGILGIFGLIIRIYFYFKYRGSELPGKSYCDKCTYFFEDIRPINRPNVACLKVGICVLPGNYKKLNMHNLCKGYQHSGDRNGVSK